MKRYKKHFKEAKEILEIPNIPNTLNFWHGGDLSNFDDSIAQKNGRYEYGPGLYLITHYETARKYSKGSRKLYLITVKKGKELNKAILNMDKVEEFIDEYVIKNKRNLVYNRLDKYVKNNKVKAYLVNNIILNEKAIKSTNTKYLRNFFVENGIDYEIVSNPFGWGEDMMVLYNMKKIVQKTIVKPTDIITEYDLKR